MFAEEMGGKGGTDQIKLTETWKLESVSQIRQQREIDSALGSDIKGPVAEGTRKLIKFFRVSSKQISVKPARWKNSIGNYCIFGNKT